MCRQDPPAKPASTQTTSSSASTTPLCLSSGHSTALVSFQPNHYSSSRLRVSHTSLAKSPSQRVLRSTSCPTRTAGSSSTTSAPPCLPTDLSFWARAATRLVTMMMESPLAPHPSLAPLTRPLCREVPVSPQRFTDVSQTTSQTAVAVHGCVGEQVCPFPFPILAIHSLYCACQVDVRFRLPNGGLATAHCAFAGT